LRAGLIGFSCKQCEAAPYIKEINGCEKPIETPATWLGEEDEFYNCPLQFILPSVYDMIEKLDSYKSRISTPPEFEKQSARFLSAVKLFEHYVYHFTMLKQGK
jgi:hypothetical protein